MPEGWTGNMRRPKITPQEKKVRNSGQGPFSSWLTHLEDGGGCRRQGIKKKIQDINGGKRER